MKLLSRTVLMAFAFSAVSSVALAQTQPGSAGGSGGATTESGASGAGSGAGAAGGTGASGATSFGDLDKDSDGYISSEEAAGVSGLDVQSADTDNDGRLSRTEFEAAMQEQGAGGGTSPGSSGSGGSGSMPGSSGTGSGTR